MLPDPGTPSGLCHVHDPAVQCRAVKKNGQRCVVATGGGRCSVHQAVADKTTGFSDGASWLASAVC
jgi:hypothetical protein